MMWHVLVITYTLLCYMLTIKTPTTQTNLHQNKYVHFNGLSYLAPISAPSKKYGFGIFLDGMKPNPTLGQGFGFVVFFSHTP
jgi:hypothetical protein